MIIDVIVNESYTDQQFHKRLYAYIENNHEEVEALVREHLESLRGLIHGFTSSRRDYYLEYPVSQGMAKVAERLIRVELDHFIDMIKDTLVLKRYLATFRPSYKREVVDDGTRFLNFWLRQLSALNEVLTSTFEAPRDLDRSQLAINAVESQDHFTHFINEIVSLDSQHSGSKLIDCAFKDFVGGLSLSNIDVTQKQLPLVGKLVALNRHDLVNSYLLSLLSSSDGEFNYLP